MKRHIVLLFFALLLASPTLQAQKAQEVLGIAKEDHPISYYEQQADLWRKQIDLNPKNAFAYFQHYKATKAFLQLKNPATWLNNKKEIFDQLKPIVDEAKTNVKSSFEYHLLEGINREGDERLVFLIKAYRIDPTRHETYESIFIHYVITFNEERATEVAQRMLATNHFSNANLMWNRNGLETCDQNGIYMANGDMDTAPKWVLQYGKGLRKDVLVISKWKMAYEPAYRAAVFKKLNMTPYDKSSNDFDKDSDYADYLTAYILKTASNKAYIGVGTPVKFFEAHDLDDSLYLVGTAFIYAAKRIDNMAIIQKNFQTVYKLEYLLDNFQSHHEDQIVKKYMNVTYIPGLLKMKKHFEKTNDSFKANYYQNLLLQIAEESGRSGEVLSWF